MSGEIHIAEQESKSGLSPELLQQLRSVSIVSSLRDEELMCFATAQQVRLEDGDFVARQGETAHFFWILLKGELQIYQTQPDGRDMNVSTMTEGSAFGEVPLLANIPNAANLQCKGSCSLLKLNEDEFWNLMTVCPEVRKAILGNMAVRLQKIQSMTLQQEKMASLGTMAAGLMHELNNPGAAASRAASQLRANLLRMHELSAKFGKVSLTAEQRQCMWHLQADALNTTQPVSMNSLEQSDAEEELATWMEEAEVEDAWKLAPTLVSIGFNAGKLECARQEFRGEMLSATLSWLEALVSSMQLVGTIEESIGRVSDLVRAVKSYAYEGKGQRLKIDVNDSIRATLVILAHKMREKEIVLEKQLAADLPPLDSACSGLNQIWTNLLDNAIDAVPQRGKVAVRTWAEEVAKSAGGSRAEICISVSDDGSGIPLESQQHIFDPFYTTKAVGVGTGLGLGIVHRIVEQLGGTIRFSSDASGTTFLVRLPMESA